MKYPNWNANHDGAREKEWTHEHLDVKVYIGRLGSSRTGAADKRWNVRVVGDDAEQVLDSAYGNDTTRTVDEILSTKDKALVMAYALLDAINAVYSVHHKEDLEDKEYFQKTVHAKVYYEDERDISKGNGTGVLIIGAEKSAFNQLAYEEYNRQVLDYYMSSHVVETVRSFRYAIVDYDNDFDDYSIVEESRSRAGIGSIEELDEDEIPDCEECGGKIAENPETCDTCAEAVKEAEDAIDEFMGY